MFVRGEDVLDLAGIEARSLHRPSLALEREPGVPFNQNEAPRTLNHALSAEIAFDTTAGKLPQPLVNLLRLGADNPRLLIHERLFPVAQVELTDRLASSIQEQNEAAGPGDDPASSSRATADQRRAADLNSGWQLAAAEVVG